MAFRKHFTVTNVSSVLGIISFVILAITLPKKDLNHLTSIMLLPLTEKLNPGITGTRFSHWVVISSSLLFYILVITAFMKAFFHKHKTKSSPLICQEEIAAMLDAIDVSSNLNINEKILAFMKTFDEEVANIFGMEKEELKSLWVFQINEDEMVQLLEEDSKKLYEHEQKSFLMIVDLDDQSMPSAEEKRIIQWALQQPNPQFWDDRIMRNFKGEYREFVFVRNYGEFRLGYAILLKEHGLITEEKLEQFQSASSYLMLLGKIDNLTSKMITYILKKVV
jgi:hypothetical protein